MTGRKNIYTLSEDSLSSLKEARDEKGLTQEELAELVGSTRVTYNKIENGRFNVVNKTFIGACDHLDREIRIYVVPKGAPQIELSKIMDILQEKDGKIAALEREVEGLKRENTLLQEHVEILAENRELRKNSK